jgi:glycosyltransferase involved in cell wall biosynthesis
LNGRRPRILVLIKGLGRGGAERLISEGARFWNTEEFDYRVAYLLPWKNQLVGDLEGLGIPVDSFGGRRGVGPSTILRTRRAISRVDLVHAHLPSTGILARLVSRVPIVYTEHNMVDSYRRSTRKLNEWTYRRNRATIAVSAAVAASAARFKGPPITVIPNGVACKVSDAEIAAARTELGLKSDDPLVAHVGNIRPHKGHSTLINAVAELKALRPDVMVASIGGEKHAGDLDRVRTEAEEAGVAANLRFLGSRENATSFLAAADVVVNPSDFEGLPVVLLEALSLRTPVVATDVGGVSTIIKDGETGLLVDPGKPGDLAREIARLLGDFAFAKNLATKGRQLVERDFSLEAMVRRTEDVYRSVLNE